MDQLLASDIFLLMLNLSQLRDRGKIIQLFLEAVGSRLPGLDLRFEADGEELETQGESLVVGSMRHKYGRLVIDNDGAALSQESAILLRNAVGMLGLILENRHQAEMLRGEMDMLDQLVAQRTAELRREVEERRRAQEALRLSEERLRLAMDATHDGLWDWRVDTGKVFWSPACYTMLGYAPDEFPVSWEVWIDLLHPADRDATWEIVKRQLQKGGSFNVEFRYRTKDGGWKWVNSRGRTVAWAEDGEPQRMIGTHRDIGERKRAEEALRFSEERLGQIVEFLPDATFVIDTNGRVTHWNKAMEEMTNITAEEMIGQDDHAYAVPFYGHRRPVLIDLVLQPRDEYAAQYTKFERRGDMLFSETDLEDFLGRGRAVLWNNASPLRDTEGRVVGAIESIRDITQQRLAEEEREAMEKQLIHAQKMEAIGTLAGGIAHDFNNILGAIMGYSELALDMTDTGQGCAHELSQVIRAAERAKNLVRQILTFSRKVDSRLQPVDLNREVKAALAILERTVPKMISIEAHLAPESLEVEADPNQIEQVILNLANNAAQAMPEGGRLLLETARISLDDEYAKAHLEVSPGDYVQLKVSDTGVGMDKRTREQIFDPFFTTKPPGQGTGLGLSTVFGIVKGHGGHIYCYSEVGQGTVFSVYLPQARPAAAQAAEGGPGEQPDLAGQETILLVDDDATLRTLGVKVLEAAGYEVLTADSGEQALEVYGQHLGQVDLVVLDLGMPGMGGQRCLEELLRLDPAAKVLIASGYSANGHVKEALAAGALGFVAKPFRRVDLLGSIRQVLAPPPES